MSFLSKNRITYIMYTFVYIQTKKKENSFENRMSFFDRKKGSCEPIIEEGISVKSHLIRKRRKRK